MGFCLGYLPRNFSQDIRSFLLDLPSSSSKSPDSFSASSQIDCVIAAFLAFSNKGTPLFLHSEMTG